MTSVLTVKREVKQIKENLGVKGGPTILLHMWLPDWDERHSMTDREIIEAHKKSHKKGNVIIAPLRDKP